MRKIDIGALIPIGLMLILVMAAWLGIAGPIVTDVQSKGVYDFLKDWQILIAAMIALAAAAIITKRLRGGVAELQRQFIHYRYETLRQRSIQLNDERALLGELKHHMEAAERAIADISQFQIVVGIKPNDLARLDAEEAELAKRVRALHAALGRTWGNIETQTERVRFLDLAQRMAAKVAAFDRRAALERRMTPDDVTAVLNDVSVLRKQAFQRATAIDDALEAEMLRTGRLIAESERQLW